jgi:hypothetical protein
MPHLLLVLHLLGSTPSSTTVTASSFGLPPLQLLEMRSSVLGSSAFEPTLLADPYPGQPRLLEIAAGAGAVAGGYAVTALLMFVAQSVGIPNQAFGLYGVIGAAAIGILGVPAAAVLGASLIRGPRAGSWGRALIYAYAGQLVALAVLGALAVPYFLGDTSISPQARGNLAVLGGVSFGLLELVGLPVTASLGLHGWSPIHLGASAPTPTLAMTMRW